MKMAGRFHTAAMLRPSWKAPMLVAPSPKRLNATPSVFLVANCRAAPTVTGMPAPTMAKVGSSPTSGSLKCIEPPSPPMQPI